jgi:hypothetical protein
MDWMLDDDSGPKGVLDCANEVEKQEKIANWREAMLEKLGFSGNPDDHDDVAFLETVEPEWREQFKNRWAL